MLTGIVQVIAIAYLPGALVFRVPAAGRAGRARLTAEERLFWAVTISAAITTITLLALASFGAYTFPRLVWCDLALSLILAVVFRRRLRYDTPAARPSWSLLGPVALIAAGLTLYFPPSEYVIGGKDPGVYMNQGIQIGQRGSLTIPDAALAAVPEEFRDLFLAGDPAGNERALHQGVRFMGFFVADRARGEVIGQFPHGFPGWIAIGYAVDGLTGARRAVGIWAIFGLLAVYFAAARLAGPIPALAGCLLLAFNVAEVWYARYPNAEMMQQALLFAALLAAARAFRDDDTFFRPVAGVLLGLLMFVRVDSAIVLLSAGAGLLLIVADGKRLGWSFLLPLAAMLGAVALYVTGPLRIYFAIPLAQLGGVKGIVSAVALLVAAAWIVRRARGRWPDEVRLALRWLPRALAVAIVAAAGYAYFLRAPVGRLAPHDAFAFRTFAWYLSSAGLLAAVVGLAVLVWKRFWDDPVLFTAGTLVSAFFFYKIRIVPEHFWQARRYLPVILPLACVAIAAGSLAWYRTWVSEPRGAAPAGRRWLTGVLVLVVPMALIGFVGWQSAAASRPLRRHVEYAGVIPALEKLAGRFGERDLVLVEPRYSSDTHVLATPLAYIYAKHVLLVSSPRPDPARFQRFLDWASRAYERTYLLTESGLDVASPSMAASAVANERFTVPEYESLWNEFPHGARPKKFNINVYRLSRTDAVIPRTDLDIGGFDDLWVLRVFAREEQDGVTFRWIRNLSYVSLAGVPAAARALVLSASSGGRPGAAGEARVQVFLNDHSLGSVIVTGGFSEYRLAIPPSVAEEAAGGSGLSTVRLLCTTWSPGKILGGADDRELGVMLDRVRVE